VPMLLRILLLGAFAVAYLPSDASSQCQLLRFVSNPESVSSRFCTISFSFVDTAARSVARFLARSGGNGDAVDDDVAAAAVLMVAWLPSGFNNQCQLSCKGFGFGFTGSVLTIAREWLLSLLHISTAGGGSAGPLLLLMLLLLSLLL